ncbi:MAG TPA: glycosyltransferase family 2 protein [Thermoanaerobaculia bacterium]|nr:glycosyltransferase family 2 protein [Thermoanaerobaculia bacterium]
MRRAPDLSVVLPVYNEIENLDELRARLTTVLDGCGRSWEIVFVDDGSRDGSFAKMEAFAREDGRIRVVRFARNFGHQMALTAGVDHARGRLVAVMDADLQDPPELLSEMLKKADEGFEVVYAQRSAREGETAFKKATAAIFYRLMRRWTNVEIPVDTGDFRLMGPRAVSAFRSLRERHRFIRGMTAWVGFAQTAVLYVRPPRTRGETKWPLRKMLRFAVDALTSFSHVPLQLATWLGFLVSAFSFLYIVVVLVLKIRGVNVTGWTTLMFFILFLGGVQLIVVGVLGEYVGRIYEEVKRRPLYLVAEVVGGEGRDVPPAEAPPPGHAPPSDDEPKQFHTT